MKPYIWMIALIFSAQLTQAQATCSTIVQTAISSIATACEATARNQACYGNGLIDALGRVDDFQFDEVGDISQIEDIQTLTLSPMNEIVGTWGVAYLHLQANLPDSLPGQNVTVIAFGDTQLEPLDAQALKPTQAVVVQSGVGALRCGTMPTDGLLIQSPRGTKRVEFFVNDVSIKLGSTLFIQMPTAQMMRVTLVEGSATITAKEGSQNLRPGYFVDIPLGTDYLANDVPSLPQPYPDRLADLPLLTVLPYHPLIPTSLPTSTPTLAITATPDGSDSENIEPTHTDDNANDDDGDDDNDDSDG